MNYIGLAALTVLVGLHQGLPLGIQILGKPFAERKILGIRRNDEKMVGATADKRP